MTFLVLGGIWGWIENVTAVNNPFYVKTAMLCVTEAIPF